MGEVEVFLASMLVYGRMLILAATLLKLSSASLILGGAFPAIVEMTAPAPVL